MATGPLTLDFCSSVPSSGDVILCTRANHSSSCSMSNYSPCTEPIALMSVGVQKAARAGADRRQAHGAPCRAAVLSSKRGRSPSRAQRSSPAQPLAGAIGGDVTGSHSTKRAAPSQQKGEGEGTRAEEKCVLFCRTNSSSPGNNRAGVSPESPYVSPLEQAWRGTSADRCPLELSRSHL